MNVRCALVHVEVGGQNCITSMTPFHKSECLLCPLAWINPVSRLRRVG